jgi:cytochrome c
MDSFEWNKIAGAVLGTTLFVLAVGVIAEAVFDVEPLEKQAFVIEGVEETAAPAGTAAPAAEPDPDFGTVIAAANVQNGASVAERCAACHSWDASGKNMIGPSLHGVVMRPKASHPGFDYSPAMKAKGGAWTYADLFHFLKQPAVFIPGTKMAFAGLPRAQDRIDIIAFLRMQADSPAPLPPPQPATAEAAPAGAAPAEGAAAQGVERAQPTPAAEHPVH